MDENLLDFNWPAVLFGISVVLLTTIILWFYMNSGDPDIKINISSLRKIATKLSVPQSKAAKLKLEEDQRRWLVVGIVLNKIVVPALRPVVDKVMKDVYNFLDQHQPVKLNAQTLNACISQHSHHNLEYRNINSNYKVRKRHACRHYDYKIWDHVDFAKLFLKDFMVHFSALNDDTCDASALLCLIINVDDSQCAATFAGLKKTAKAIRKVRNSYAHCNFTKWDQAEYNDAFTEFENLLKLIQKTPDLHELHQWQRNGTDLGKDVHIQYEFLKSLRKDHSILAKELLKLVKMYEDLEPRTSILEIKVRELGEQVSGERDPTKEEEKAIVITYKQKLTEYHQDYLDKVSYLQPVFEDLPDILQLNICQETNSDEEDIKLNELFSAKGHNAPQPRTVVLRGADGSGKTLTINYLLREIINRRMYKDQFDYVFLIRLGFLRSITDRISFRFVLLEHQGPKIPMTRDPSTMEQRLDAVLRDVEANQNKVLFLLDGMEDWKAGSKKLESNSVWFTSKGVFLQQNERKGETFKSLVKDNTAEVLLDNLFQGHILPDAKIILTSVEHETLGDRLVQISGLTEERIKEIINKEFSKLPQLSASLIQYITKWRNVGEFCQNPLQLQSLLKHVKSNHGDDVDGPLNEDTIPKGLSGLLFLLDLENFRSINESAGNRCLTDKEILVQHGHLLSKLGELAFESLPQGRMLYTEEEIKDHRISLENLNEAFMISTEVNIADITGTTRKKLYQFVNHRLEMHLGGLHLNGLPVEDIQELALKNKMDNTCEFGCFDELFIMYAGIGADSWITGLLSATDPQTLRCKVTKVLESVRDSSRIWEKCGERYYLQLLEEAQLFEDAQTLAPTALSPLGTWELKSLSYLSNPSDQQNIISCLQHLPQNYINCLDIKNNYGVLKHILREGGISSMSGLKFTIRCENKVHPDIDIFDEKSGTCQVRCEPLQFLWLKMCSCQSVIELLSRRYQGLQCLWLYRNASADLAHLSQVLNECDSLQTLGLENFYLVGCSKKLPKSVKYLILRQCTIDKDTLSICLDDLQLIGLWLTRNHPPDVAKCLVRYLNQVKSNLEILHIWGNEDIPKEKFNAVSEALNKEDLKVMHLDCADYNPQHTAEKMNIMHSCLGLEEVRLCVQYETAITTLCEMFGQLKKMRLLDFSESRITPEMAKTLTDVIQARPSIEALILRKCQNMKPKAIQHITKMLARNESIKLLDIAQTYWSNQTLIDIVQHTKIEVLDIRGNWHEDVNENANLVEALCENRTIQTLACDCSLLPELYNDHSFKGPLKLLLINRDSNRLFRNLPKIDKLLRPRPVLLAEKDIDISFISGYRLPFLPSGTRSFLLSSGVYLWDKCADIWSY